MPPSRRSAEVPPGTGTTTLVSDILPDGHRTAERWPVALAMTVAGGAWVTTTGAVEHILGDARVPATALLIAGLVALCSLVCRRPVLACLAAAVLAIGLTQRSRDGLEGHERVQPVSGEVTLVSDPRPTPGGGVRAEARMDGRRLALEAYRSPAAALRDRLAGERVIVIGEIRPPGRYERLVPHRHLAGRLRVDTVVGWQSGHGVTRAANGLRRTLATGAESLSERHQSLLAGLLLGDSRDQPADLTDAFRGAGLAHLLVVSGSNVAVLLAVLSPVLTRLRLASRLVVSLGALGGFAVLTRGEPSVLRATAMAALGVHGAATGRPAGGVRRLSLAVAGLVLVDPLLITALGFQLSVAGAAGIIVGARPLEARLPGPRWLALPVAVTVAAEIAVAPLLVATFGSVPLVSLPANLLAALAAGPVKAWGLSAGILAGVVGEPVATVLHLPTWLLLSWLDGVATVCSGLPVGELRAGHLAVLVAAAVVVAAGRRIPALGVALAVRLAACVVGLGTLTTALLVVPVDGGADPSGQVELGPGMDLWRGGGAVVLVVDGRATEEWLAAGLRRQSVDRVDVLVLRTSSAKAVSVGAALAERWPAMAVLVPPEVLDVPGRPPGAAVPAPGSLLRVGSLEVVVDVTSGRLVPEVTLVTPP